MQRHILGVVTATIAAPYLVSLVDYLSALMIDGPKSFMGLIDSILLGTNGLLFFGIPTLVLASICAAILHRLKLRTRGWCMLGGAGVGLGSLGIMVLSVGIDIGIPQLLLMSLSGALCGWIYWRIAIRRTPENARAIEAE